MPMEWNESSSHVLAKANQQLLPEITTGFHHQLKPSMINSTLQWWHTMENPLGLPVHHHTHKSEKNFYHNFFLPFSIFLGCNSCITPTTKRKMLKINKKPIHKHWFCEDQRKTTPIKTVLMSWWFSGLPPDPTAVQNQKQEHTEYLLYLPKNASECTSHLISDYLGLTKMFLFH